MKSLPRNTSRNVSFDSNSNSSFNEKISPYAKKRDHSPQHYRAKSNVGLPSLNNHSTGGKTPKKEGKSSHFSSFVAGQPYKVSNSPLKDHIFKQTLSGIAGSYFYEPKKPLDMSSNLLDKTIVKFPRKATPKLPPVVKE